MPKTVIGLVGPIASGKGTVVRFLGEKGFSTYSLSDRIREEITTRGTTIDKISRKQLQEIANELRGNYGSDILARFTADKIAKDDAQYAAIDAIRNPHEVIYLKKKFGAKIIGVIADQRKRFEMFKNRGVNNIGIETWEQFKALDDQEFSQEGQHKQQINECLKLADIIIENNGTVEELKQKVEEALADLQK